jgi:hypothetical protein
MGNGALIGQAEAQARGRDGGSRIEAGEKAQGLRCRS